MCQFKEVSVAVNLNEFKEIMMNNLNVDEIFDAILEKINKNQLSSSSVFDRIQDDFKDEISELVYDKTKELQHYKDTSQGLWVTAIAPEHLFHQLMQFRSDANPFEDGGECIVKDGYKHIADMWDEFYQKIFFQFNGEQNDRQILAIIDDMCSHSLCPDAYEKWEAVKKMLFENRKNLRNL